MSHLLRISYCADDKAEKRFFSFIAKEADEEKHTCFVFVSDKLVRFNTWTFSLVHIPGLFLLSIFLGGGDHADHWSSI